MGKQRILLVDDHEVVRIGLRALLERNTQFEVVGEAGTAKEALEQVSRSHPDVVLMDLLMPGMDGIEATAQAIALYPDIRIIALSMYGEKEYYLKMIQAGVKGFLRKDSDIDEVIRTIDKVREGENCFSREMLYSLVTQRPVIRDEILSDREIQIVELICYGYSAGEIAEKLFLSKRTVEKHRANILDKTNCKNTAKLVAWAVKNNFVR